MEILHNFLSFIIIISAIVFIHEFGHYWVAKKCGVKVESFSIGFGPEIWGRFDKSGTRWKIAAFPLGGYVKMFGDEGAASTPDTKKLKKLTAAEEKIAFHSQPLLAKTAIVSAGPIANFLLAIFILFFFFAIFGRPETSPEIESVQEGSVAEEAGLKSGDLITELNGTKIERFEDIKEIISLNPDIMMKIIYLRQGSEIEAYITPKIMESEDIFGNKVKIGMLGVTSGKVIYKEMSIPQALVASVLKTYNISIQTLQAVGQMITGTRSTDELGGILKIAQYSGQSVDKGLATIFWFMAVLSINLGLINLFPIPMLDGGHLLFYAVEAANGRPLAMKVQEYAFRVGFVLLITLMAFATYNDLRHFGVF